MAAINRELRRARGSINRRCAMLSRVSRRVDMMDCRGKCWVGGFEGEFGWELWQTAGGIVVGCGCGLRWRFLRKGGLIDGALREVALAGGSTACMQAWVSPWEAGVGV